MCLIAFAYKTHPEYKLILIANRDEFYERPTRPAQFWEEEYPEIFAGKDEQAGGTWMGFNKRRQWAALTNYRDPSLRKENAISRGQLVLSYLKEQQEPAAFLEQTDDHSDSYEGFNLLAGNTDQLYHYSNVSESITRVTPGVHGLSNALLNTSWPKLEKARGGLADTIQQSFTMDDLFSLLADTGTAPDDQLPSTGIPAEWEKAISPVFIKTDGYGTRSSTVLLIGKDNTFHFTERRFPTHQPDDFTETKVRF